MNPPDECADDIVLSLFDRVPALAALSGHTRSDAREECHRLIASILDGWFGDIGDGDWVERAAP